MFTHIYDCLIKIFFLFFGISCAALTTIILLEIGINTILVLPIISIIVVGSIWFYDHYLRTLATYLYCRFTLKVKFNFAQARNLNDAITPFFSIPFFTKWLPMKELKTLNISDDDKYQLANFWRKKEQIEKAKGRSLFTKDFKDATLKTQVLFVVMLVSIAYTFIATINYLPPVNYIIYHVCAFLGIETYSAGLFSMIFSLIITSIFTLIDPKIVILLTQMLNPDAEKNQSK